MERTKIHQDWQGVVLQRGESQSLVRITECDYPPLIGKEIVFMNHELETIPPTLPEEATMAPEEKKEIIEEKGSGQWSKDEIVKKFKFKNTKERNSRRDLLELLIDNINQMVSKKSLGDLAPSIPGLIGASRKLDGEFKIRKRRKNGQIHYGLFEVH